MPSFLFDCCSVTKSCLTLRSHGLQLASLSCPSQSPGACSSSCPLSRWCHPTISSSVAPFSCLQSFPASGSFPMSWLFTSGGQSIGASASAPPMNIQGWFPITIWLNSPFYNGEITTFCERNLCHSRWDIGSLSYRLWLSSCLRNGVCMGLEKWLLSWVLPRCIRCNACCILSHFSHVWLCNTVACQAPLYMKFSRQEYWMGCYFLLQDLPDAGIELGSPALQARSLPSELQGSPQCQMQRQAGCCLLSLWRWAVITREPPFPFVYWI